MFKYILKIFQKFVLHRKLEFGESLADVFDDKKEKRTIREDRQQKLSAEMRFAIRLKSKLILGNDISELYEDNIYLTVVCTLLP